MSNVTQPSTPSRGAYTIGNGRGPPVSTLIKIKLSQAIEEYLRLSESTGKRANTLANRRHTLLPMVDTIGDIYVSNLTPQHLEKHMTAFPWKASTRNVKLANIKHFLAFCERRRYKDPTVDIVFMWTTLKFTPPERLRVPVEKWDTLFEACDHPTDKATMAVGLYLFLRVSEARALRWEDIHFDRDTVSVTRVKTADKDELPMALELREILWGYKRWYTEQLARQGMAWDDHHVVLAPRATRMPGWIVGEGTEAIRPASVHSDLGHRVEQVLYSAGYTKKEGEGWGCHVLRRSGARALFDELVDNPRGTYDGALRTVQSMLGHASVKTTEVYLGLTLDREKRNNLLAGQAMFPRRQSAVGNVTPIRRDA